MSFDRSMGAITGALLLVAALPVASPAQWSASRVDAHAPIGVMGDHRHEAGEMMLGLRYMPMHMEGSRIGTDPVSNATIVAADGGGFMVTPAQMDMTMVMGSVMFAPSDRLTLMAMVPYLDNTMDHVTRAGGAFRTASSGVGDVSVGGMIGLGAWARQTAHLNLAVSVPTGSITATDVLPTSNGTAVQLPYPMQLGSGTWDIQPGLTWLGQGDRFSFGVQAKGVLRMGHNDRDWKFGNRADATAWFAVPLARDLSISARGAFGTWGDVDGTDPAPSVNPAVVPTARPDLRGGSRLDLGAGINWYVYRPGGLRLAAEFLRPVYQDLHGPQLETDWTLVIGVQAVPIH